MTLIKCNHSPLSKALASLGLKQLVSLYELKLENFPTKIGIGKTGASARIQTKSKNDFSQAISLGDSKGEFSLKKYADIFLEKMVSP